MTRAQQRRAVEIDWLAIEEDVVTDRVELAQMISQLRQELSSAMREGVIKLILDPRQRGIAGRPVISGPEQAGER